MVWHGMAWPDEPLSVVKTPFGVEVLGTVVEKGGVPSEPEIN